MLTLIDKKSRIMSRFYLRSEFQKFINLEKHVPWNFSEITKFFQIPMIDKIRTLFQDFISITSPTVIHTKNAKAFTSVCLPAS